MFSIGLDCVGALLNLTMDQLRKSLGMGIPDQAGEAGKEAFLEEGRGPDVLRSQSALDGV